MKTVLTRRAKEWDNFLESILKEREKNGELLKLKKPELERLILHNFLIPQLKEELISIVITERERRWIRA